MVLGTPMKTLVAKSQHAIIFMRPMRAILDVESLPNLDASNSFIPSGC